MKPETGKSYYIDFHDCEDYQAYHGPGVCESDKPVDCDGPCYSFSIPGPQGQETGILFPQESIITETK